MGRVRTPGRIEESLVRTRPAYRVVNIAAGQLSASAAKRIDIERGSGAGALPRAHVRVEHDGLSGPRLGIRYRTEGGTSSSTP